MDQRPVMYYRLSDLESRTVGELPLLTFNDMRREPVGTRLGELHWSSISMAYRRVPPEWTTLVVMEHGIVERESGDID